MGSGTGLELRPMYIASSEKPLYCDVSTALSSLVSEDLVKESHVFLRIDRVLETLEPLYAFPYKFLSRTPKVFIVEIDGKPTTVSIDTLRAKHLIPNDVALKIFPLVLACRAQKTEVVIRYGSRSRTVVHFQASMYW
ncbi:hypothetical protein AVEN_154547-1 [Araneus ventricosus]|uniref:Uncharacterized protein n=1 Tax=Araneus ventricosus TaxID=182803 RepID=A0A4Y2VBM2_ARAVE|nr:hypothetical protein AVEN_154547-1 [Araneus ventricosus]